MNMNFSSSTDTSPLEASNTLIYDIGTSSIYNTTDGSGLDAQCTGDYSFVAKQQVISMVSKINEAIATGLCPTGVANVEIYSSLFSSFGNQVSESSIYCHC
jgi:hypothetical protein